jgi:hypothetical protein
VAIAFISKADVHPTDKGYADMANLWYGVIKGYLPQ